MTEYIEREALMKNFCGYDLTKCVKYGNENKEQRHDSYSTMMMYEIANEIEDAPASDVAEVVRCRDCKHAWIHPCGYVYCHRDGRNAYEMTFNLDSFCSYGERKDNG